MAGAGAAEDSEAGVEVLADLVVAVRVAAVRVAAGKTWRQNYDS